MPSNYKRLGDYIQEVNIRNRDLSNIPLLGVSIKKVLMPSIANIIGTDMSTYKLIRKNQFAYGPVTSRNGDKISIALLEEYDNAMVSQAYTVFEVIDENELLPEYLMMWFRRPEFDRYARFMSHGSAREIFSWTEMSETLLPIPSIEKQQEIVREYNTIQNRIALNNQLISKLEETAQAIYKQWFVDFEFPFVTSSGVEMPYKSNGGKMIWCEELEKEIPEGWEVTNVGEISNVVDCLHSKKPTEMLEDTGNILLQINNISDYGLLDVSKKYFISNLDYKLWTSRIEISEGDCIITNVGVDGIAQIPKGFKAALGRNMTGIRLKNFPYPSFIITLFLSNSMKQEIESKKDTGTIMQALNVSSIYKLRFLKGNINIMGKFEKISNNIRSKMELIFKETQKLEELKYLLLAKMTRVES